MTCLLVAGAAACTSSDPATTTLDQGAGYRQVPTSREAPSKQALDDINRELDAARTTVTTPPPSTERPSTTSTSAPSTESTFAIDTSTSSEPPPSSAPAPPAVTPGDCKQFQQLVSFVGQVKDLIDPGNPDETAQRLGPAVDKSKAGFDQLLETKITEVAEPVRDLITWLRARGAGKDADDQAGLDATAKVDDFVKANCR